MEDRPQGRPTKYRDEFPSIVLEKMSEGLSVVRVCAYLGIVKDTFYRWVKEYKSFSDSFERGKIACESYWEKYLVENFDNKDINSGLVKLFMAVRFDWREKTETLQEVNLNLSEEHKKADEIQKYYEEKYRREE